MYRGIFIALIAILPAQANAQESTCVELARTIGLNYTSYLSADEQRAVAKADMCSESYSSASSSRQAQIEASYKLFSGSASGSAAEVKEAQSKHCEGKFGDYWRSQLKSGQARTVSSEGAAVISTCLAMNSDFLFPTLVLANGGQEITMAVQYKPTVVADIQVAQFGPSDLKENTCTVTKQNATVKVGQANDVTQTLKPLGSITTNCVRKSEPTQIDGVTYTCTKETIFVVATSGPVRAIKIPRTCLETIQESRADQIEKKADAALQRIAELARAEEAARATLKANTNAALQQLTSFDDPKVSLGFDIQDTQYGSKNQLRKDCGEGRFVSSVVNYNEDGHIKMGFVCKALKAVQLP